MAWWDGGYACDDDDYCIEADYWNDTILDSAADAYDCVNGSGGGTYFASFAVSLGDTVCASDVNDMRDEIADLLSDHGDCDDCDWSSTGGDLTAPCDAFTSDVTSGTDPVCFCDFFCLNDALACIVDNCCPDPVQQDDCPESCDGCASEYDVAVSLSQQSGGCNWASSWRDCNFLNGVYTLGRVGSTCVWAYTGTYGGTSFNVTMTCVARFGVSWWLVSLPCISYWAENFTNCPNTTSTYISSAYASYCLSGSILVSET